MMSKVLSVLHGSALLKIFIEIQKLFHDDDIFPSGPRFKTLTDCNEMQDRNMFLTKDDTEL